MKLENAGSTSELPLLQKQGSETLSGPRVILSKEGLERRDHLVIQECRKFSLPIAVVMGGGYSPNLNDIVEINTNTVKALLQVGDSTN